MSNQKWYIGSTHDDDGNVYDWFKEPNGSVYCEQADGHLYTMTCSVNTLLLCGLFIVLAVIGLVVNGVL